MEIGNGHAHCMSMLLGPAGESIPVRDGELASGSGSGCCSSSSTASATAAGWFRSSASERDGEASLALRHSGVTYAASCRRRPRRPRRSRTTTRHSPERARRPRSRAACRAVRRPVHLAARERGGVVAEDREQERRLDRARAERVDADSLARKLHPELRDIERTAPFDAVYEICEVAAPRSATNDATLITEPPPRSSRYGMPCLQQRKTPFVLTSWTRCHASTLVSRTDASSPGEMPALL